ncbi:unnamed protein product [Mycena citricolor]|uniref:DH domain-containing protein n=1 Tax=Mycena citricolor TaxID=2018698 RepID=A0AAD2GVH4_9AGAR|nr:unnamed protein product [Mycena citricolor]
MHSSFRERRMRHPAPERLTISGFLPLPPITASPVCTPTSTLSLGEVLAVGTPHTAAPHFVAEGGSLRVLPTWISTPPTPPPRHIRRSVTCIVRRPPQSPPVLPPSASVPLSSGPIRHIPSIRPRARSDPQLRRVSGEFGCRSDVSDISSGLDWHVEKARDDVRRYHALMELLSSEVRYLEDLRALLCIYLNGLPTLCRTSSTGAFGRTSRNNSYTHLPKANGFSEPGLHPLTSIQTSPSKQPKAYRPLFADWEIKLLTRNAKEVLRLHENFVAELRETISPIGFVMEEEPSPDQFEMKMRIRNIDAVVGMVSAKFATEASPLPIFSGKFLTRSRPHVLTHTSHFALDIQKHCKLRKELRANIQRNGMLSNNNALLLSLTNRSIEPLRPLDPAALAKNTRARTNSKESATKEKSRRLLFQDYLIKPVQRICRYPLLLDQLGPSKKMRRISRPSSSRPPVEVVVESAAQAMRHVASAVDEARHRQAILTPSFLSSLGTCLLAGSLDVMHYHSSKRQNSGPNINAKYLGAFLYLGGYLILVKVIKGKVYEPRHWFSLVDFEVVDLEEEDTSLPCTFSLTCEGNQFDLTAACQREKDAWLSSIRESKLHPPAWINEPTSSIHLDCKGEFIASTLDGPFEIINALPTIQSLPELSKEDGFPDLAASVFAAFEQSQAEGQAARTGITAKNEPITSRRSSTASVRAIFSASSEPDTIVIRRSSPAARAQVDLALHDVISEPILAARCTRDELFQAPKILRSSFTRSNSALSLTGLTKNRLSRHESVRVPRRKSQSTDEGGKSPSRPTSLRLKSVKRRPKRLSIVSASEAESLFQTSDPSTVSPFSQCSSLTSSLTSPTLETPPSPVKPAAPVEYYMTLTQGILRRLGKSTRHRRTRSAPHDQNQSPVLPEMDFGAALSAEVEPRAASPVVATAEAPRRTRFLSSETPNTDPRPTSKRSSIFRRLR